MNYMMTAEAATNTGKRKENQDNFCIDTVVPFVEEDCSTEHRFYKKDEKFHLVCVCDGIGGGAYGDMAAVSALDSIGQSLREQSGQENPEEFLVCLVERADNKVRRLLELLKSAGGTTLAMILWKEDDFYAVNVGDSPIYLLRKNKLYRLSELHTLESWKRARGMSVSEADRHTLVNYLGKQCEKGKNMMSIMHGNIRQGDIFLVCSDGVPNGIQKERLVSGLLQNVKNRAERIVNEAAGAGGADNCTAVVLAAEIA